MEAEMKQIEAKHAKKGVYIMFEDAICRVTDVQISSSGKHGHKKCRIQGSGLSDGKTHVLICIGDAKLSSPIIEKKTCQILAINNNIAQCMDLAGYETFEMNVPEDMKTLVIEGAEVSYWVIGSLRMFRE